MGRSSPSAPTGPDETVLATGDPQSLVVLQAVWSPDGEHVAWAQVDDREGEVSSRMIVSDAAGGGQREALLPVPVFYLFWDPTSTRIAFLGEDQEALPEPTIRMGVVEPRADRWR